MQEKKHRIVIDTNLWISFLLTRDFTKLDLLLSTNQIVILVSQELIEEIVEVAERPKFRKYFDLFELTELLLNLQQNTQLIRVTTQVNVCRDYKDNFLLSLAIDGTASHILTGDKDLLVLHPFDGIQVLTIQDYLSDK